MNLKRRIFISFLSIFFLLLPSVVFGVNLDLPFKSQLPPGTLWKDTRNCGQTSFLMISAYYNNDLVTEQDVKDLDDWIEVNLGDDKRDYYGNYTSLEKLKMIAISYSGYQEDTTTVKKGTGISFLKDNLDNNIPVLIDVYTNMLKYGGDDARHFMVLTGIDDEYVYVNDPGKTKGKNNKYTIEQFKKAWAINGNQALVILPNIKSEQPFKEPTPSPTKSFWQKFKDFFTGDNEVKTEDKSGLAGEEDNDEEVAVENEDVEKPEEAENVGTYNLSFVNSGETVEAKPGEVINLTAQVKNIGTENWQKNNISANVVGGMTVNANFYHNSWLTSLRPALLDLDVRAGESGNFSFVINTPEDFGEYVFKIQAVRVDNGFSYILSGFWTVKIVVIADTPIVEVQKEKNIQEKIKNLSEKISEEVGETIENVKEVIKKIFYNGNNSSSNQVIEDNLENDELEIEEVVTTTENVILPEVSLIYPTSTIVYTTSTFYNLTGGYNSSTYYIFINNATTTDLIMIDGTWSYDVNLEIGTNTLQFVGWDESLSVSSTVLLAQIIREEEIEENNILPPPVILAPTTSSVYYTSSTNIIVVGEKTIDTVNVFVNKNDEIVTTTILSTTTWEISLDLIEGENNLIFYGVDETGLVQSTITSLNITVDSLAPELVDYNIEITTSTVLVYHPAEDSGTGVVGYQTAFLMPLSSNFNPWNDCAEENTTYLSDDDPLLSDTNALFGLLEKNNCVWFVNTGVSSSTVFNFVEDLSPFYIQTRAWDNLNNYSAWHHDNNLVFLETELLNEGKVIINEIAWMGTSASFNDEWIELCNVDEVDIYLENWRLVWDYNTSTEEYDTIINLWPIILPAWECILLERTDQSTVSDYDLSQIYDGASGIYTGILGNDGEDLVLYSGLGNIVDEVNASSGWFAGDNDSKDSMLRIDPEVSGSDSSNWGNFSFVNQFPYVVKHDADGKEIIGSPGNEPVGYY